MTSEQATNEQVLDLIPYDHAESIYTLGCLVWKASGSHITREQLQDLVDAGLVTTLGPRLMPWGKSGSFWNQYYRRVRREV
jgi:hypothetical protein